MLSISENPAVFNNTKLCNSLFYCIGKIGRFMLSFVSFVIICYVCYIMIALFKIQI